MLATSLHLLIAYELWKAGWYARHQICEMVTGAASTSGEANYSGSHGGEYVLTRPTAKRQRLGDVHSNNDEVYHSYPEPTYGELQAAQACTQHVPSFDLPKYNHLFDLVELAPMELTDFTKFSVAKLYCQFYDLHAVPHVSVEILSGPAEFFPVSLHVGICESTTDNCSS